MFTNPPLTSLPVNSAQVEMELMFLSPDNRQHCLELIMQLDADARGQYLQLFLEQHIAQNIPSVRRFNSIMEWLLVA